jgi:uncharacterized alkaline shock family protein YloU
VYALVGASGTGKSFQALRIARERGIDFIIDDGLLISKSKKIGGISAKREATRLTAVKRAIFHFDEDRNDMKQLIDRVSPDKLLIIGTSDRMVVQIADNLEIAPIDEIFHLEDMVSPEDIRKALLIRKTQGKHVIPLPTLELKKDFSGYFMDKLRIFVGRRGRHEEMTEKTIIRPTFSYIGKYSISPRALQQIMAFSLFNQPGVHQMNKGRVIEEGDMVVLVCDVTLYNLETLIEAGKKIQLKVKEDVENMTGLHVQRVEINITNIQVL